MYVTLGSCNGVPLYVVTAIAEVAWIVCVKVAGNDSLTAQSPYILAYRFC